MESKNQTEEKKWAIGQLTLIMDMLVDEIRTEGESISTAADNVWDIIESWRDRLLAGLGFIVTLVVGLGALGALGAVVIEETALLLIAVGLVVYVAMNYLRDVVNRFFEPIENAYETGADRIDFFRGQFYSVSIHLDRISLEQIYSCESFIKVLLGEVAGTIRMSFSSLLGFTYKPSISNTLKSNLSTLDQMIDNGYKVYQENKSSYEGAHGILGTSLAGAEQFAKWYEEAYPRIKSVDDESRG